MSGFKTKARTVELLGRKQIRDSVTALAELMKNAYDADAPWLRVEFSTTGSNQHVVIVDTGLGMSQNDIESKWLVLGTNSKTKRANKTSPSGRPLMGAKGIGRLASATLGKQLWMFTKTEESLWNIVFINWDIFENPYISIEDVRVPTRFGVSSQELILRFDSIIAEMLSEQRSNLENPGWYPENDIDGIVAPLLNGIRNSLSKASIEKKDVEKYIASFKCGTINNIWEVQNLVQKILEKEIFPLSAKAGLDHKPFITITKKPHHIAGTIGVIDALEDHLILRNILCILYGFGKYEYAFTLKLFQRFICNFTCQLRYLRKDIFFLLGVILDPEQLHSHHLWRVSDSRMPLRTDS